MLAETASSSEAPQHAGYRVAYLVNFLAPDLVAICRAWAKLVGRLDVIVSVPMEGNRHWTPCHDDLNVTVQRTWTISKVDRHPSGYDDVNYVHIPLDTYKQLRSLQPAVIVSAEMGARSLVTSVYCCMNRRVKHVVAVSTSEHIEQSRDGWLRRLQRRWLLRRADAVTYHGESCRQYLLNLGVPGVRLFPWIYAADPTKPYRGEILATSTDTNEVRLLTVGQLIDRKGVLIALHELAQWATEHPDHTVRWLLIGNGPMESTIRALPIPENMQLEFAGHCSSQEIQAAYRDHELLLFPTLGDEWGLVVDEAMHSGLAVIGSNKAQSCQMLIRPGTNGYLFDPAASQSLAAQLTSWAKLSASERMAMRHAARRSVSDRTPENSARQIASLTNRLFSLFCEEQTRML